jgi:hypothetical protein
VRRVHPNLIAVIAQQASARSGQIRHSFADVGRDLDYGLPRVATTVS